MDPLTFLLLTGFVAYVVVAPDSGTRTVSRGVAGAARAASRAGWRQVRAEWAATAPVRKTRNTARRKRWAKSRTGRVLLAGERALRATPRVTRFGWRLARAFGRIAGAAASAVPDGWRTGVQAGQAGRGHRSGRTNRPVRTWDDVVTEDPPALREDAEPDDEERPTSNGAGEPPSMTCPECGEPVVRRPPRTWLPAWGPRPEYSHLDGEPLCPVSGPDGYVPAEPVASGGGNQDAPAPAGGNREEHEMSTNTQAEEAVPIRVTEMATIDDLRFEAADANTVAHIVGTYLVILADWIKDLPDRYAGAPFGTAGLARGVAGVVEAMPDVNVLQGLHEAFAGLQHEIDETTSLTEAAEALDADGQVGAYRTS
jgi:hypothetical protein